MRGAELLAPTEQQKFNTGNLINALAVEKIVQIGFFVRGAVLFAPPEQQKFNMGNLIKAILCRSNNRCIVYKVQVQ